MSNRIRYNQHVSNTAGDNESKLVIVKILFLATGFLLTYENLFGVFDDIKLRLLSVIIGGSLMFLGCKDTIQLIFEECFYQPISYKNAIRISKTNANCISPNSLTLQTLNGVTKHRRSTGKKSYNDENSEKSYYQIIMAPTKKNIDLSSLKKANVPIIFIVGGPGSGKGTQCDKIVAKYGFTHISSGDLLREELKSGSERAGELLKIMELGQLVPMEVVLDLIKERILQSIEKGSKGFLIDGYPREIIQGEKFESEIQEAKTVIYFEVAESTLVKRLLYRAQTSGRADDNEETIKKRITTFNQSTAPVVDYYEKKGKLLKINAEGSVDDIFTKVSAHLDKIL
ncbi:Adenylate kinase isoenzyme 1 [Strongyloides ratti]|uniref:Adenylate kinase isoenzyme 1 n=1 Tax=Strongyloides ratti TaxID=34506 RepID=A0A090LIM4_STRRB|nr:Adenylate kinase isoenzyme 1 [Strongyloides ratti]CEF69593.1 Adenylate kinase isoenzyme 1 [Strongyloides ratti]